MADEFKIENIELQEPEFEQPFYQSPDLNFGNVRDKKFTVTINIPGLEGADSNQVSGVYWICPFKCVIERAVISLQSGATGTPRGLYVEKLTSGQAVGGGTNVFSTNWEVGSGASADTPTEATLVTNASTKTFNQDDRIGLVRTASLSGIFGIVITLTFKII